MLVLFFTVVVFGTVQGPSATESLGSCFRGKEGLLGVCRPLLEADNRGNRASYLKDLTDTYPPVEHRTILSLGYSTSTAFEFLYALCCLPQQTIQIFLEAFKAFHGVVLREGKTTASASFLMVCAAVENDPVAALEYIQFVIRSCQFPDPTSFGAQFNERDNSLPYAYALMHAEEKEEEDWMIARLQTLVAARAVQPDQAA